MSGDDALDDFNFQFVNVQEPVKHMLSALAKAIRSQSIDIRDLDKRISNYTFSKSEAERMSMEFHAKYTDKSESAEILQRLLTKADHSYAQSLETKLLQANDQITKLTDLLQHQSNMIRDLHTKSELMQRDIEILKVPKFDVVYAYCDRHIENLRTDVDRQMAMKADKKEVETCIPQRLEDLYRSINGNVIDMKQELARKATKEDFELLLRNKADSSDVKSLAQEVSDRVTSFDLQQTLNSQLKPVVTAISAVEKSVEIQERVFRSSSEQCQSLMTKVAALSGQLSHAEDMSPSRVRNMISEEISDRRLGEVTSLSVQALVAESAQTLLREMSSMVDSAVAETKASTMSELARSLAGIEMQANQAVAMGHESQARVNKVKQGVKELAEAVAKSLGRKVDYRDLKQSLKEIVADQESLKKILMSQTSVVVPVPTSTTTVIDEDRNLDERLQEMLRRWKSTSTTTNHLNTPKNNLSSHNYTSASSCLQDSEDSSDDGNGSFHVDLHPKSPQRSPPRSPLRSQSASRVTSRMGTTTPAVGVIRGDLAADLKFLTQTIKSMKKEVQTLRSQREEDASVIRQLQQQLSRQQYQQQQQQHSNNVATSSAILEKSVADCDWRLALGEVSINLRRELSDKCNREEMYSAVHSEIKQLEALIHGLQRSLDVKASAEGLSKMENEVVALRSKVAGELTGARWLWTSGSLHKDGWIPWDHQVTNAAPAVLQWKKGATAIKIRMPGLYRLTVAVFTTLPVAIQVCLNGEAIVTLQPDTNDSNAPTHTSSGSNPAIMMNEHRYLLRRVRHSIGEVTCVSIDECLSLPPEAAISVRYHSTTQCQGFLAIRKL